MLSLLDAARASGDLAKEGHALLELAFMVKWVRSDNHESPFERSHRLALEALEVFRRAEDVSGQISALLLAHPFERPEQVAEMLAEAERLANALGSELDIARVLAARARKLALTDRDRASVLMHEALALFRKLGNAGGMANCLFSLSITDGTALEKKGYALEAARLYREAGNRDDACKAVQIAVMNAQELGEITALEAEIREGLQDAQAVGDRPSEGRFYSYLAEIAEAKGNAEEAAKYLRWKRDLAESDDLSPLERWKEDVTMTKLMIAMAKRMGAKDTVRGFEDELRRLMRAKP